MGTAIDHFGMSSSQYLDDGASSLIAASGEIPLINLPVIVQRQTRLHPSLLDLRHDNYLDRLHSLPPSRWKPCYV
jgi:hypothetical protein